MNAAIIGLSSGILIIVILAFLKILDKPTIYGLILSGIGFLKRVHQLRWPAVADVAIAYSKSQWRLYPTFLDRQLPGELQAVAKWINLCILREMGRNKVKPPRPFCFTTPVGVRYRHPANTSIERPDRISIGIIFMMNQLNRIGKSEWSW